MTTNSPIIIPAPIPQKATQGEKKVYQLLRRQLPAGYVAWYELTLSYRRESRYPDFIIIGPTQGIIVLEVKDWVIDNISEIRKTLFVIRARQLKERDPFKQARENALLVNDIIEASNNPQLIHTSGIHQGRLQFPYRHAVILTNISHASAAEIDGFSQILKNEPVLLKDDLDNDFVNRIFDIPAKFQAPMSSSQIDAVRGILYPEVRITNRAGKVLDYLQDGAIKSHLSEEAERALGDPLARLVRGPAGSGKSLILIKRAILESTANPAWRILVFTYNRQLAYYLQYLVDDAEKPANELNNLEITNLHKWCRKALESIGEWQTPIGDKEKRRLVREAMARTQLDLKLSDEFISEEIAWMKERELTSWDEYKIADRKGRGIGLNEAGRSQVFQVWESYQQLLGERIDWEDVPLRVLRAMEDHLVPTGCYEAIFVDEAQDFAPSWAHVIRLLVNPKTSILFLAADSTQRIYQRGFSWKNLGLDVSRRTLVLKKRYRNPLAIQQLAYELIKDDEKLKEQLADVGEELIGPDIELSSEADSTAISFRGFRDQNLEYAYLATEIRSLVENGYSYSDISIFHRYGWGIE